MLIYGNLRSFVTVLSVLWVLCAHVTPLNALSGKDLYYGNVSDNFIVRWSFQEMCDHVFDPRTIIWSWPTSSEPGGVRFDPNKVKRGDLIFARDIDLFFEEIHPFIKNPYIIITHGEFRDTTFEYQLDYLDDDKVIAWFSIHPPKYGHKKYFPLPLGINQDKKYFADKAEFNSLLKELREVPKTKLLYMNIALSQNPERQHVNDLLGCKDYCDVRKAPIGFTDYLKEMAEYKFALSPRGWGPDCYRTYEALIIGTIPIVRRCQFDKLLVRGLPFDTVSANINSMKQRSQLDRLYEDLPILVIDDWTEITEEFLNEKYEEITSSKYDLSKLYMEYWIDQIKAVRKNYLRQKI